MIERAAAALEGPAALPRENGELVFAEPWQSLAFGIAVALSESGAYDWDEFREQLIAEIGAAEPDDGTRYYERWLASLERVLADTGVVSRDDIARRVEALAAHDHHDHDH